MENIYKYEDYRKTPFKYGKVDIKHNIIENYCEGG